MTIGAYVLVLRRRWRVVAAVTLIGLFLACVATVLLPKTYAAQSTNFVSIAGGATSADAADQLYQNSQFALNRVQSYPELITSPTVLRAVIDDLDLRMSVGELRHQLSAVNPTQTVLIQVRATSGSAQQARDIANAASRELDALIERLERTSRSAPSPVQVTVAVPATAPAFPASPNLMLNVAAGLLLGLAVGAVAAVVVDRRDVTVKSPEDVERLTGANPLGTIRSDAGFDDHPLLTAAMNKVTIEDFRAIRTRLKYVDVDHDSVRQLVVTSSLPGEGKSIVACNLALVMAQDGRSVCLIEADLRRPKATRYFGVDGTVGLTEVVAGEFDLDDVMISWNRGTISILPAGTMPPDPTNLLGSQAVEEVLEKLRAQFDVVIIDAPPLLPVSDAAVLATAADGVLLVVRHGTVSRVQVDTALRTLSGVGATVLGTILNATPSRDRLSYYGPDYDYLPETADSRTLSWAARWRSRRGIAAGRHATTTQEAPARTALKPR